MKVLHLTSSLGPTRTAKYLASILPHLASRHSVITIGSEFPFGDRLRASNIPLQLIRFRGPLDVSALSSLSSCITNEQPDILHVWGNAAAALVNGISWPLSKPPYRIVLGDLYPTNAFNRFLIERTKWRAVAVRDSVPNGTTFKSPSTDQTSWGIPHDAHLILNAGLFDERSEQRNAIWVFDMLRYSEPTIQLAMLGDGPQRRALTTFARSIGRGDDRVHFLGIRSDVDLLLERASAVLLTHRSGGHTFAREALDRGRPVVAAVNPDLRTLTPNPLLSLLDCLDRPVMARRLRSVIFETQQHSQALVSSADSVPSDARELENFYASLLR